jgi:hypothetical protein
MIRRNGKPAKQIPAIEDRRLGQLLTGVSVKNIPALTYKKYSKVTFSF